MPVRWRAPSRPSHVLERWLIVTGSALTVLRRDLIIALAARYRLPAVYYERYFVSAGGLICYGTDYVEQFRLAAPTSIAYSRTRSRAISLCRRRPSMNWSSTSKPRRHSG